MPRVYRLVALLILAWALPLPAQQPRPGSVEARVAALVSAQATVDMASGGPATFFEIAGYPLAVHSPVRGARVWAGATGNSPRTTYIVVEYHDRLFRLGGFPAPELLELAAALPAGELDPVELARALITLNELDRASAVTVVTSDSGNVVADTALARWWRAEPPPSHWRDTVLVLPDHRTIIYATALVTNQGRHWATRYCMYFDSSGRLLSWTRGPEPPLPS